MKEISKLLLMLTLIVGGVKASAQITNDAITYTKTNDGTYKCSATNGKFPQLWSQAGWKGVITMYFGGWKYQSASAKTYMQEVKDENGETTEEEVPYLSEEQKSALAGVYTHVTDPEIGYETSDSYNHVDSWKKIGTDKSYTDNYPQTTYAGYTYKSFGTENAKSEFLEKGRSAGNYIELSHKDNTYLPGNPFSIACFGTFMKFEPSQNGTVTLHILQNGIVDLSGKNGGPDQLLDKATWRPTYIVDELGNQLIEGVSAETNQTIYIGMDEDRHVDAYDDNWGGGTFGETTFPKGPYATFDPRDDKNGYTKAFWTEVEKLYNGLDEAKQKALDEHWGSNVDEGEDPEYGDDPSNSKTYGVLQNSKKIEIIKPSETGDGWVTINKAFIKYTFPVKAGKTYYVFNNQSKLGFCGYEFQPDETQPSETDTFKDDATYTVKAGTQYKELTLQRTFKKGWNAICLPFSVTESKMREAFGTDGIETYELVTYNGAAYIDNKLTAHFFRHAYQDIVAGIPYMIWIPKDVENVKFNNVTIEDVTWAPFNTSTAYMDKNSSLYEVATLDYFTFKGFYEPTAIKNGDYCVEPNGLALYSGSANPKLKGFRSVLSLTCPEVMEDMIKLAGTNFTNILDEMEGERDATIINSLAEEMGLIPAPSNVYSLSGQLVRQNSTSLEGLPKGIYIVNGKKYFVN